MHAKTLAIIPARGGSKGLPGKNTRPLCGKPLIAWTIEQALQSGAFDTVVVSTDSEEIAAVASSYGADVPFLRPAELATDTATSVDVVLHALDFYEGKGKRFDYVALLEPTSPLRKVQDLIKAKNTLSATEDVKSVVGVAMVESQHPAFLVTLNEGWIKPYIEGESKEAIDALRRQDICEFYFFEGSLYIAEVEYFKQIKAFYHAKTKGYVVEKWQSFEIDDICDFEIVEFLMSKKILCNK